MVETLGIRRNELWTQANFHYHRGNWQESTRLLLLADQLEDESARAKGLDPLDLRIIGDFITCSIGHSAAGLAMRAGLQSLDEGAVHRYWVLSSGSANPAFLDYWKPYFTVMQIDEFASAQIERTFWPLLESMSTVRTLHGSQEQRAVHNHVALRREEVGMSPILKLSEDHISRGNDKLHDWGLGNRAWFVTLHVREGPAGYGRNANISSYIPAIQEIIRMGGAVIRIGTPDMQRLPTMDGLYDYANSDSQQDWLDIYLMGACRFLIGTTSGPLNVSYCFGRPMLWTNAPDLGKAVYFPHTIMLPKLVVDRTGSPYSLQQLIDSPAGWSDSNIDWITDNSGSSLGLNWRDNTAAEIHSGVVDMLDFTASGNFWRGPDYISQDPVQRFLSSARVGAVTPIAPSFLSEWEPLLS